MPVLLTRHDFQRIIAILHLVAKFGHKFGLPLDLVVDANHYGELLETQLKLQ
jgi:hypothetical protein